MDLPPEVTTGRDVEPRSGTRLRVCKRCKFSTTDAKEFLHHQMNAHANTIETYSCDTCDFLTVAFVELQKHKRIHHSVKRSVSQDSEQGCSVDLSSPHGSDADSEKHSEKSDVDAIDERSDDEFPGVINNVTLPTRTYSCQECGVSTTSSRQHLRHLVEEHSCDYSIYECDICDYATRYKQKLPRHRKCHFTMPTEDNFVKPEDSIKMEVADDNMNSIPRDSAMKSLLNSQIGGASPYTSKMEAGLKNFLESNSTPPSVLADGSVGHVDKKHFNGGSFLDRTLDSSFGTHSRDLSRDHTHSDYDLGGDDDEPALVIDTQHQESSPEKPSPASLNQMKPQDIPKKRPGPREAVDPAKYVRVQEVDGIKYACSKCGNVYKWKKSLNKHWKEKHDGEIPVPHSGNFPVLRVPTLRGSPNRSGHMLKDSSGSSFLESSMDDSLPTQVPFRGGIGYSSKADMQRTSPHTLGSSRPIGGMYGRDSSQSMMKSPFSSSTPVSRDRSQPMPWNSPDFANRTSTPSGPRAIGSDTKPKTDPGKTESSFRQAFSNGSMGNIKMPYHPQKTSRTAAPPPAAHARFMGARNLYNEVSDEAVPLDLSSSAKPEPVAPSHPYLQSKLKNVLPSTSPVGIQDEPLDFSAKSSVSVESKMNPLTEMSRMKLPVHVKDEHEDTDKSYFRKSGELNGHKTVFGNWQCSVCAHVSKTKAEFEEHMEFHLKKRYHKCAECKQSFGEIEDLNQHFVCHHVDILKRSAQEMEKSLPVSEKARESIQLYKFLTRAREPYLCVVCGQEFAWQWDLTRHFDQSHSMLPNPYRKRDQAEAGLDDRESPKRLKQGDSSLKCGQCRFVARSADELSRHHLVHSLNLPYACTMCGYSARYRDELMTHIHRYHKKSLENSAALDRDTMDLGPVKQEVGEMSPDNISIHSSEALSPTTSHQEHLVQMQTPDGGITTVDLNAEGTVVVIPEAPEETSSGNGRARNLKVTKPTDNSAESLLPYKCTKCEYRARWPSEINQHMKNHSDEKPFLCPFCNYKSKWKWDVVKHLKRCGGGTVKDVIDTSKLRKEDESHWVRALNNQSNNGCSPLNVLSGGPPNVTVLPSSPPISIPAPSFQYEGMGGEVGSRPVPYSRMATSLSPSRKGHSSPAKSIVNQGLYHCLQCPFVGNSPAELKRHCRVHSDEKPFMCLTCGYSSKWKCDLKKHLRTYNHVAATHLDTEDLFTKDASPADTDLHCHEAAVDSMDLDQAQDEESLQKAEVFRCDKCLYVTYTKHVLDSHMKIHSQRSEQKSNRLKCKQCDFEAEDLPSFLQHKVTHSNQQSTENTSTGSTGFPARDGSEEREPEFGSHSKQSVSPTRNRRKHIMQFRCSRCSYTCFKRSDLETHEAIHETYSQESYKCSFCEYNVNSRNLLMQHMKLHPEFHEEEDDEESRLVALAYDSGSEPGGPVNYAVSNQLSAPKKFQQESIWQNNHNKSLVGKPLGSSPSGSAYKCTRCPYSTNHRNNYEKHIVNHGTNNKYTCEWCDWSTDRINLLYRHAKCVHKNELNQQVKQDKGHKLGRSTPKYQKDPVVGIEALDMTGLDSKKSEEVKSIGSHSGTGDNTPNESEMETEDSCAEDNGDEAGKENPGGPARKKRKLRTCGECGYTTDNITNLQRHQKKHGQNGLYKCDYCSFSLDRLSLINQHMNMIHGTSRKGMRRIPKVIPPGGVQGQGPLDAAQPSPLANNMSEDNDEGNESESSSTSVPELEECIMHLGQIDSTETVFVAGQHVQVLTSDGKKFYRCMKCAFIGKSVTHLSRHLHHHAAGKRYTCEYCDYSMDHLHLILHHMRTVHQEEGAASEDSLLPEEKMDMESEYKPLALHSAFDNIKHAGHSGQEGVGPEDTSLSINRELFLSTIGLKPVGKVYSTSKSTPAVSAKQRRPRVVVPSLPGRGKGRVRYRCTKCPYTTVYRGNIFKHRRQHVISSKYTCQYCNYSATRWHVLEKHVKFHRQELENADKDTRNEHFNDIYMDPDKNIEDALSDEGSMLLNFSSRTDYNSPLSSPGFDGFENGQSTISSIPSGTGLEESKSVSTGNVVNLSVKKQNNHECGHCPYFTSSPVEFEKHVQSHGPLMKFKCDFCTYSVSRINLVYQHRKLHVNEPNYIQNPPINSLLGVSSERSDASIKLKNDPQQDQMPLDSQKEELSEVKSTGTLGFGKSAKTPSPKSRQGKISRVFSPKVRSILKGPSPLSKLRCSESKLPIGEFQCSQCPFACSNKQSFAYHETLHKVEGRYSCDKCSYSVNRVNLLYQHTRLHNIPADMKAKKLRVRQPNKKRFKCPKCPYHTHSGVILAQHTKLHAAGKRFACQFCDYSIGRLNLLHQHLKLHVLPGSAEKSDPVDADLTGVDTKESGGNRRKVVKEDKENLAKINAVLNTTTEGKVTPTNTSVIDKKFYYKCERCPYQTNNRGNFENHKSQHVVRSKLQCPYCDYSSPRSMQLSSHVKMHFPNSKLDSATLKSLIREANQGSDSCPGTPVTDDQEAGSPADTLQDFDDLDNHDARNNNERPSRKGLESTDYICQYCDRHFGDLMDKTQHEKQHLVGTSVH